MKNNLVMWITLAVAAVAALPDRATVTKNKEV